MKRFGISIQLALFALVLSCIAPETSNAIFCEREGIMLENQTEFTVIYNVAWQGRGAGACRDFQGAIFEGQSKVIMDSPLCLKSHIRMISVNLWKPGDRSEVQLFYDDVKSCKYRAVIENDKLRLMPQ